MNNLREPLKDGRVRLLLNAGDHVHMHKSLKETLQDMGVDFKVAIVDRFVFLLLNARENGDQNA